MGEGVSLIFKAECRRLTRDHFEQVMALYNIDEADYLGSGAFGEVYGIDEHTALKVIHVGRNENLRQSTLKEIQFMLNLKLL